MPEFNFKSPVVTRKVRETELILVVIVKLICYIAKTIKFNSNKIILKENDIMLDSDGKVILDKSINYGKQ